MFDDGIDVDVLAGMPTGTDLATALARVDRAALNGFELVEVAKATCRQVAHYQAELLATVAEIAYCPPGNETSPAQRTDHPAEYAADEVRLALTLTRRAADILMGDAYTLVERLPTVHQALRSGQIDLPRARVLDQETAALPEPVARDMVDLILPAAGDLTTGQLRIRLRRMVIETDPSAAATRQRQALARRRVEHGLDTDGTATLAGYHLPPDRAATAAARIDTHRRTGRTWTTPPPGKTADPPQQPTSACCADTATATNTATASLSPNPHPAPSNGPPNSATPTPPHPNHPDHHTHPNQPPAEAKPRTVRRSPGRPPTKPPRSHTPAAGACACPRPSHGPPLPTHPGPGKPGPRCKTRPVLRDPGRPEPTNQVRGRAYTTRTVTPGNQQQSAPNTRPKPIKATGRPSNGPGIIHQAGRVTLGSDHRSRAAPPSAVHKLPKRSSRRSLEPFPEPEVSLVHIGSP
ncbi:hypothetical protein Psuf_014860 [Phytohabitans suffuscus]|uniref:DUF222 domain-containing protein n=1 Tax=Phytohabitans suffuscus TaxID=624315 RepID=A0A6F8YDR8_9ACTN|nr:hypothetical protein Psuf_014860 [Phytohabitans suffuscus]